MCWKGALVMGVRNSVCLFLLLVGVSLFADGCVMPAGGGNVPNSHFAYPNSNIEPLGTGEGSAVEVVQFLGIIPAGGDAAGAMETAIQRAIETRGGDLLLDYNFGVSMIMLGVVSLIKVNVSGTVAKMTIGLQTLHGSQAEAYPSASPTEEVSVQAPTVCSKCQAPLRPGYRFCNKCGTKN